MSNLDQDAVLVGLMLAFGWQLSLASLWGTLWQAACALFPSEFEPPLEEDPNAEPSRTSDAATGAAAPP